MNAVAKACAAELHELTAIAWDCTRRGFEACGGEGQNELASYFRQTITREADKIDHVLKDRVSVVAAGLLNKSMIPLTEVQEAREHLSTKYEAEIALYLAEAQRRSKRTVAAREKATVSSWPIQTAWFIAGILGTGAFWYFLSQKEVLLTWLSGLGTLVFFAIAVWLHIKADASSTLVTETSKPEGDTSGSKVTVAEPHDELSSVLRRRCTAALLHVRSHTSVLWPHLKNLGETQTALVVDIRLETLREIEPSLRLLSAAGMFAFSTLPSREGNSVQKLTLASIHPLFRSLVNEAESY